MNGNIMTIKMIGRVLKAFLIFNILTFAIYSFSFAQSNLANVIIEERIDELWTTGKLKIGYANIASKHWLPDLYERNNYQLLWQTRKMSQIC